MREDNNLITRYINAFKNKCNDDRTIALLWERFRNAFVIEKKLFPRDVAR